MSCDGWGVGDKCKSKYLLQLEGPSGEVIIKPNEEGVIREVKNYTPHRHALNVFWYGPQMELIVEERDFPKLEVTTIRR